MCLTYINFLGREGERDLPRVNFDFSEITEHGEDLSNDFGFRRPEIEGNFLVLGLGEHSA